MSIDEGLIDEGLVDKVMDAVNPGLPINRTIGKHTDKERAISRFNDQLRDELSELKDRDVCRLMPGSTTYNWMAVKPEDVPKLGLYEKWLYFSCRIESMVKANMTSDLILYSLSYEFDFIGAGSFGTVSTSSADPDRRETTSQLVMKSSSNMENPTDLIHEVFIASYLNQLLEYGIPNFLAVYGYTPSCNTPVITEEGIVNTGCEREGQKANILTQKIYNIGSLGNMIVNHFSGRRRIADTDEESITILMEIFLQIFAALAMAQNIMKFSHLDLHISNILITKLDSRTKTTYQIGDRGFNVESHYRPTIIDYGMSRISVGCKTYIDRRIFHLDIARTDLLEGHFIPWYDVYRVLNSVVSAVYEMNIPNIEDDLVFGMLCYLYTQCFNDTPDDGTQDGYGTLPKQYTNNTIIIRQGDIMLRTQLAIDRIKYLDEISSNKLGQTSMADYDINSPECMIRLMTTRKDVHQFVQGSCRFSNKKSIIFSLSKRVPDFGSETVSINLTSLIELKLFVLDKLWRIGKSEKDIHSVSKPGSLVRHTGIINKSVQFMTETVVSAILPETINFNFITGVSSSTGQSDMINYLNNIDILYTYYLRVVRANNWRVQILGFLETIDPHYLTASDQSSLKPEVSRFMKVIGAEIDNVNTLFDKLLFRLFDAFYAMERNGAVNSDYIDSIIKSSKMRSLQPSATFPSLDTSHSLGSSDMEDISPEIANKIDYITNTRYEVGNGMYDPIRLQSDHIIRDYYTKLYEKTVLIVLRNTMLSTTSRLNKIREFMNTIIDFKPIV